MGSEIGFCAGCQKIRDDTDNDIGLCTSCEKYYREEKNK